MEKELRIFKPKSTCSVCGHKIGVLKYQIENNQAVCHKCFKESGLLLKATMTDYSVDDIDTAIVKKRSDKETLKAFKVTKRIGYFIEFDDNLKKWLVPDGLMGKKKNPSIYDYTSILRYELIEDGKSLIKGELNEKLKFSTSKTSEHVSKLVVKITLKGKKKEKIFVSFLDTKMKRDSTTYETLYQKSVECMDLLQSIIKEND